MNNPFCLNQQNRRRARRVAVGVLWALAAGAVVAPIILATAWICFPFPEERLDRWGESPVVRDATGAPILQRVSGETHHWRMPVRLGEMSPWLVKATIALEDERFHEHMGIDPIAVGRAARDNVLNCRRVSGASTITMQVCRMMDDRDRTYAAKAVESFRALQLEAVRDKEAILETYLNIAPYGGNIRGVEAAAQRYFGVSAKALSLAEAALIAGLPQSPERLRPDRNLKAALARRRTALRRMHEAGMITAAMRSEAEAQSVALRREPTPRIAGHFAALALQRRPWGGVATLDPDLQFELEWLAGQHVARLPGDVQVAVVVIDIPSGGVAGMIGSRNFGNPWHGQVNGAMAWRSPGEAVDPFIYAAAFEDGDSIVNRGSFPFARSRGGQGERPGGDKSEALRLSLSLPAVHVARAVGARRCGEFMEGLGVRWKNRGLGTIPGGGRTRLLDLANAYATIGRGGEWRELRFFIDETTDARMAVSAQMCAALDAVYSSHSQRPGTLARRPDDEIPWFMWQSGLSPDRRDAWAVGHNRRYAIGVWMGRFSGPSHGDQMQEKAAEPLLVRLFDLPGIRLDPAAIQTADELSGVRMLSAAGGTRE